MLLGRRSCGLRGLVIWASLLLFRRPGPFLLRLLLSLYHFPDTRESRENVLDNFWWYIWSSLRINCYVSGAVAKNRN